MINNKKKTEWKYWKTQRTLEVIEIFGLPSKKASTSINCLEKDERLSFDSKTNAEIFKDFYLYLASDLLKKLPSPPNKFWKEAVKKYYENISLDGKSFYFNPTMQAFILKLLEEVNPSKSAGIDNLAGKFLKEGVHTLASPITDICPTSRYHYRLFQMIAKLLN